MTNANGTYKWITTNQMEAFSKFVIMKGCELNEETDTYA